MDWELIKDIATIASPIVGVVAIIVALIISRRSSRDAQKQIDVFMAAQAPDMIAAKEQYEKQLQQLDGQIAKVNEELSIVDPFAGKGPLIDQIDRASIKQDQRNLLQSLLKQREKIVKQIQLIESFLKKQIS